MKERLRPMIPEKAGHRLALMLTAMAITLSAAWYQSAVGLLPENNDPEIIFSHRLHVVDEDLECSDCHDGASDSELGTDNLLPEKELCADCHEVEDEDECSMCHSNLSDPQLLPRIDDFSPIFSHKLHLESDLACESCHSETADAEFSGAGMLPGMVQCLDCHDQHAVTSVECTLCHSPEENLIPNNHSPDFIHAHSDLARTSTLTDGDKTCQTCHDTNFCQDCHEGDNLDNVTHPLNFEFTHALEAQANERLCVSCHAEREYCVDCHNANQVLPYSHVPGFVNNADGGLHAFEASNDIESCMSCHNSNAEEICQQCHVGPQ
jgi:hypothetical protein